MNNTTFDPAEFESLMSLDRPINSSTVTRWERKANQQQQLDRYIPNRSAMEKNDENLERSDNIETSEHTMLLLANQMNDTNSRVLTFKRKAPAPSEGCINAKPPIYSTKSAKRGEIKRSTRHIPSEPMRVLDAPTLLNDYYLNLMSWGCAGNLALGLSRSVFLWNPVSASTKELMFLNEHSNDYVTSVSWIQQGGNHLAVGTAESGVQLWDVQAEKRVRSLSGHASRVGALAWNGHMLTSGSRDNAVLNHDVRIQNHIVGKMLHHSQEVCGLAWSPDGTYLASGANDNTLCITEASAFTSMNTAPKHVLTEHQAAVKALAWSPHERNLLASGGGTADRCIKFWNAASGSMVNSVDTGSQVCALQWSPFEKEILSSHGYAENQLCLWKYPTMAKVKELRGHTSRVLHMAVSPDGAIVCSGAADETLCFWEIFAPESKGKHGSAFSGTNASMSSFASLKIR
eukprot:gene8943-10562_t